MGWIGRIRKSKIEIIFSNFIFLAVFFSTLHFRNRRLGQKPGNRGIGELVWGYRGIGGKGKRGIGEISELSNREIRE